MSAAVPEGVPPEIWQEVLEAEAKAETAGVEVAAQRLLVWADGRSPDELEVVLDALRAAKAYATSLEVLEAAWDSNLPLERLGRIAEDWLGTVLHGIGDRAGAIEVANHLAKGAKARGPAFAADLGHLMLEWGLRDEAAPLIEFAAGAMPGDMTLHFALGIIRKFEGRWAESRACFEQVLQHQPKEQASLWNLGIACTALHDWGAAREAWSALGMTIPTGDGDFASEGDVTPVKLPVPPGAHVESEVVWGLRICPARIRLRSIPRYSESYGYYDIVLIDGVSDGQAQFGGRDYAIFPALASWESSPKSTYRLVTPDASRVLEILQGEGWPAVDWSSLPGEVDGVVGITVSQDKYIEDLRTCVDRCEPQGGYALECVFSTVRADPS